MHTLPYRVGYGVGSVGIGMWATHSECGRVESALSEDRSRDHLVARMCIDHCVNGTSNQVGEWMDSVTVFPNRVLVDPHEMATFCGVS